MLDDLTPGAEDGLPFGPMPFKQEEQLSKLFANELAFLNSSASSSSSDLQEQLSQDQANNERDLEGQERNPDTSLDDLFDDATLSETSEETSVGDEDRSSNTGDKDLEFNSSPSSPLTPLSPTFSHGTSTPPLTESTNDNNDQALSVDDFSSLPSTPAVTHGPSSGIVSTNKSTPHSHTHTPSPLSQPPLQPQPAQEQSQDFSTTSATDAAASPPLASEPVVTLITPGAAAENAVKAGHQAGNSTMLTTEEDGKR